MAGVGPGRVVRDPREAGRILVRARSVAVVGASGTPGKDAYRVPRYLLRSGIGVVPVNPRYEELYGVKAWPSLLDLPRPILARVDVVDVFRPPLEAPGVVAQVLEARRLVGAPRVVWFQPGTGSREAVARAVEAGLTVVDGLCIMEVWYGCLEEGWC